MSLETAVIAALGAGLLALAGVPAGTVLGAMLATAGASLAGRRLGWPQPVRALLFGVLGYGAGSAATPAALRAILLWPVSLAILAVTTAALWAAGWAVYRRLAPADSKTAFFASAPGALSTVLILAEAERADMPKVAVAQSLRILVLVCLSPFALAAGGPAPALPAEPTLLSGPVALGVTLAAMAAGWILAGRMKWPAAPFLGAMLGSAAVHAPGIAHVSLPPWVLLTAATGLGALIGSRFAGVSPAALLRHLPASLALVGVMAAIGGPVGLLVGSTLGVGPVAGALAFAPGSMEVMIAVAVALNANPAYVAVHHLGRMLLLLAVTPFLAVWWGKAPGR